jgi:hypothetical protein
MIDRDTWVRWWFASTSINEIHLYKSIWSLSIFFRNINRSWTCFYWYIYIYSCKHSSFSLPWKISLLLTVSLLSSVFLLYIKPWHKLFFYIFVCSNIHTRQLVQLKSSISLVHTTNMEGNIRKGKSDYHFLFDCRLAVNCLSLINRWLLDCRLQYKHIRRRDTREIETANI